MTDFTPVQSLLGGAMIGLATVLLMALHGRIAGLTGIVGGLLPPEPAADRGWRLALLAGMVAAAPVYGLLAGGPAPFASPVGLPAVALAGLVVGAGTYVGSGCTSGHGICGLARFSLRSLVAVVVFMATAMLTVLLMRHGWGG